MNAFDEPLPLPSAPYEIFLDKDFNPVAADDARAVMVKSRDARGHVRFAVLANTAQKTLREYFDHKFDVFNAAQFISPEHKALRFAKNTLHIQEHADTNVRKSDIVRALFILTERDAVRGRDYIVEFDSVDRDDERVTLHASAGVLSAEDF